MRDAKEQETSLLVKLSLEDARMAVLQFAVMLNSGVALDRILEAMSVSENPKLRELADRLHRFICSGHALSVSFRKSTRALRETHIALIKAGEETGRLSVVLQKLCERMDREQQIRQRLISAVTYPVGILVVGLTMVAFMATYMLPRFLESAGSALSDPPWPTRVLIAVSDNSGVLVMSSLMVLASLPWLASEVPAAVAIRTWILYRSPVVGTAMGLLERARLCNEFGLLLDAGLTVHRAMKCLVLGDPRLRDALKRATRYLVEGSSLSESFAQTGAFSPTFVAIIEVGEETGRLSKSLVQQAGLLEETAERYIDGAVKMIEPVVMIILGFFVGFVVLGCFLPIYKMVAENL